MNVRPLEIHLDAQVQHRLANLDGDMREGLDQQLRALASRVGRDLPWLQKVNGSARPAKFCVTLGRTRLDYEIDVAAHTLTVLDVHGPA